MFWQRKRILPCSHRFHERCINRYLGVKSRCPLCDAYVFNAFETELLKRRELSPSRFGDVDVAEVFAEAVRTDDDAVKSFVLDNFDCGVVLASFVDANDSEMVAELASCDKINWHASYGSESLLEKALRTKNRTLINVILDKTGFAPVVPARRLYPTAPPLSEC